MLGRPLVEEGSAGRMLGPTSTDQVVALVLAGRDELLVIGGPDLEAIAIDFKRLGPRTDVHGTRSLEGGEVILREGIGHWTIAEVDGRRGRRLLRAGASRPGAHGREGRGELPLREQL